MKRLTDYDRCRCPGPRHVLDVNGDCQQCGKYYIYESWIDTVDDVAADLAALREELEE